ncbi:MAG: hypothetical protein ACRYFS_12335 [Janthinobacterium lividum]
MSKTATPARKNTKNGATPATVKAVLEEAVQTSHTDDAAAAAPKSELVGVPYLGETRRQALALAGLVTQGDLRNATAEQIGGVKGVGMGNAARIKAWLEEPSEPLPSAAVQDIDPGLASANQNVQDVFQKLGEATARLKDNIPAKVRDKALDRQLDKLDSVASELAEGPDTLTAKQVQEAVKTLDKIAALLYNAADDTQKLSPKKQAVLIEELRTRRKRLQKTLDE